MTAMLASWLIERVSETSEASQAATRAQVADLQRQVRELVAALDQGEPADRAGGTMSRTDRRSGPSRTRRRGASGGHEPPT
ncbi:MAG: hypothetical protein LBD90_04085 [Bifidobacteriaceae bacterium]|nr:hypothetical protein [Bifidobacteriaceae bacterium]